MRNLARHSIANLVKKIIRSKSVQSGRDFLDSNLKGQNQFTQKQLLSSSIRGKILIDFAIKVRNLFWIFFNLFSMPL